MKSEKDLNKGQEIRRALEISSEEFIELGRVGAMYYQFGKFDEAKKVFEGLLELDPNSADAHSAMGALLTLLKYDDLAKAHLDRSIEINPNQIAPYVNLGEIFIRRMQIEEALINLSKAVSLDVEEQDWAANRARAMILYIYQLIQADRLANE